MFNGNGTAKYLLSKAVRDAGIKVVFTGEGADEILAGYPTARRDLVLFNSDSLNADEAKRLLSELEAANPVSRGILTPHGDTAPGLDIVESRLGFVPSWMHTSSNMAAKLLLVLGDSAKARVARASPYAELLDAIDIHGRLAGRDPVNQSLYLWNQSLLVNAILTTSATAWKWRIRLRGACHFWIIMSPNMSRACPFAARFVERAKNMCCVRPYATSLRRKSTIATNTPLLRHHRVAAMMRFLSSVRTCCTPSY
jgi:asparagine synthase (glutamine-hydrolysing)